MTISVKKICVNGNTFSLADLIANADKYLPMISPKFRASTLMRKDTETENERLARLFHSMCRKGFVVANNATSTNSNSAAPVTRANAQNVVQDAILGALGINRIDCNRKTSTILFKNSGGKYNIKNEDLEKFITDLKSVHKLNHKDIDICFGVELEFIAYNSRARYFNAMMENLVGKSRYVDLDRYNKNSGDKWILGRDASLHSNSGTGFELTSPILHANNEADMIELKKVLALIKDVFEGKPNNSCGTHIHISFNSEPVSNKMKKYFAAAYHASEDDLFDKLVPTNRRKNNGRWCRTASEADISDRYRKINFQNATNESNQFHLEFRQLDGTLDYRKIKAWLMLQKLFIEVTLNSMDRNKYDTSKVEKITLQDVLFEDKIDHNDVESLLRMSKMIA